MNCPNCNNLAQYVSRYSSKKTGRIFRKRICKTCGLEMKTVEMQVKNAPEIRPKLHECITELRTVDQISRMMGEHISSIHKKLNRMQARGEVIRILLGGRPHNKCAWIISEDYTRNKYNIK